ncbi:hypothetical protein Tco_1367453 [Tanacetum coccineum]
MKRSSKFFRGATVDKRDVIFDVAANDWLLIKEMSSSTLLLMSWTPSLQAKPTKKHLKEVKRIFRYLRGTVNMGLWYTKDSGFELTGFSDADYAGCKDTFKSTSGGASFL